MGWDRLMSRADSLGAAMGDGSSNELPRQLVEAIDRLVRSRSGDGVEPSARAEASRRRGDSREAIAHAQGLWDLLATAAKEYCDENPGVLNASGARVALATLDRGGRRARAVSRRFILGSAIAAGVSGMAVMRPPFHLWPSLAEMRADYRTAKGEQRRVELANGVAVELNTETSIAVKAGEKRSIVQLIYGEALIDVATASDAGVEVIAAQGTARAAQSRFSVRCDAQGARIVCIEGDVSMRAGDREVRLFPGQQASYSQMGLGEVLRVDAAGATAWQQGLLIFVDRPLAEVVDEVNRYRPGRIVLMNAHLGARLVNGTFRLDRLNDVIAQIEQLFGAKLTTLPGGIVLVS